MTLTSEFDLDSVRKISKPNIWIQGRLVQKLSSRHTNTQTTQPCIPPGVAKLSTSFNWLEYRRECHCYQVADYTM